MRIILVVLLNKFLFFFFLSVFTILSFVIGVVWSLGVCIMVIHQMSQANFSFAPADTPLLCKTRCRGNKGNSIE